MATSSPQLAIQVAQILGRRVPVSALLHGRQRLVDGNAMSDVDYVASGPEVLPEILEVLGEQGLNCVVACLYDVGCWSLFLCDHSLAGVQLDVTADPDGEMRYLMRCAAFVAGSQEESGIRSVSEIDGWLYELVKRASKQDAQRLSELLSNAPCPLPEAAVRARELFSEAGCDVVARGLVGELSKPPSRWSSRAQLKRIWTRLRSPVGLVVHVPGKDSLEIASELVDRFGDLLPTVRVVELGRWNPGRLGLPWGPMRFRWLPSLIVVTGRRPMIEHLRLEGSVRQPAVDRLCAEAAARSARLMNAWRTRTTS